MIGGIRSWIGIDPGNHLVKVASWSAREHSARATVVPLEYHPALGGRGWVHAVEGAIRLAAESLHLTLVGARVVVLVPSDWLEVRWLDGAPAENDATGERVRQWVLEQLRADLSDAVFDVWPATLGDADRLGVAFVPFARAALMGELVRQLRVSEAIVDIGIWSHARLARLVDPVAPSPLGILDWGARAIWFTVAHHGVPQFSRRLSRVCLDQALSALAGILGCDSLAVRDFVARLRNGQDDPDLERAWEETVRDAMASHVAAVAEELSRTLRYLETKLPHLVPDTVVVIGGGAGIGPFVTELAARLQPTQCARLSDFDLPQAIKDLTANAVAATLVERNLHAAAL